MRKKTLFLSRIVIGIGLLALVCSFIDFRQLHFAVSNAAPQYLAAFIASILLDRALMAWKWSLLLAPLGIHVPFWRLYLIYSVSPLAGTLLPSTIGGDAFRLYGVMSRGISGRLSAASMIMERLLGVVAVLVVAAVSLGAAAALLKSRSDLFASIAWLLTGTVVVTAVVVALIFHRRVNRAVEAVAVRFHSTSIVTKLHRTYESCGEYRHHTSRVFYVFGLTLVEQMAPLIGTVLLVRAFRINVSLLELIAIVPIIVLMVRLPISMDGIGVQEGMFVVLFGLVGVQASEAFLLSVTARVLGLVCALPFGLLYVLRRKGSTSCPQEPSPAKRASHVIPSLL
jgi:glycosyltransferase 2 family protein